MCVGRWNNAAVQLLLFVSLARSLLALCLTESLIKTQTFTVRYCVCKSQRRSGRRLCVSHIHTHRAGVCTVIRWCMRNICGEPGRWALLAGNRNGATLLLCNVGQNWINPFDQDYYSCHYLGHYLHNTYTDNNDDNDKVFFSAVRLTSVIHPFFSWFLYIQVQDWNKNKIISCISFIPVSVLFPMSCSKHPMYQKVSVCL